MPVKLRLQRFGRRNLPFYRIVAADSRSPRDGRFIENVGTYNPTPFSDGIKEVTANSERIKYWIVNGAQPTKRVGWLLGKVGLLPPLPPKRGKFDGLPREIVKDLKELAKKK
jgi:small subunit ribosomal protein S16